MDFDRQAIERRDFPIGRRGYDPASVDAHLRSVGAQFEELQRAAAAGTPDLSLASTAGSQVQSILEAAETAAGEIERNALEKARQVREAADHDAARTREDALEKARAHVAAIAQATQALLERVGSMDTEVGGLVESLRAGAGRLAADLSAVETSMGELYGAASGQAAAAAQPLQQQPIHFESELDVAMSGAPPQALPFEPEPMPLVPEPPAPEPAAPAPSAGGEDVDGARLIALNMALNGESRTDTERYLAENFQLQDRLKLVDEVYAAIEG